MINKKIKIIERETKIVPYNEEVKRILGFFVQEDSKNELESIDEFEARINEFLSKHEAHFIKHINVNEKFAVIEYVG